MIALRTPGPILGRNGRFDKRRGEQKLFRLRDQYLTNVSCHNHRQVSGPNNQYFLVLSPVLFCCRNRGRSADCGLLRGQMSRDNRKALLDKLEAEAIGVGFAAPVNGNDDAHQGRVAALIPD